MTKPPSRWIGDPNADHRGSSKAGPRRHAPVVSKRHAPVVSKTAASRKAATKQNALPSDTASIDPLLPVPPPLPSKTRNAGDAIVHHEPPPIASVIGADSPFQLHVAQHENHAHRESTSWFSSVLIHLAALLLIALFLVPADYGGTGMHELVVRFGDGSDPGAGASVAIDTGDDEEAPQVVESTEQGDKSAAVSSGSKSGDSDQQDGSNKGGQEGPKGSFFGIETDGHEFVYIVDVSGSMRGRRFLSAAKELVRSVSELTENQRFYVLLFSDHYVQMFNQRSNMPRTVPANLDNKYLLEEWIRDAFRGGGTDPRAAVNLAVKMNPSAIFMLSDGEFKDPTKSTNSRHAVLGMSSDADVFQIVRSIGKRTPIHAIAFEEPVACENMKRLSFMTGGKYTFIGNQNNKLAEQMLTAASDEMRTGDLKMAKLLLQRTIDQYGNTDPGWDARERLARMVFDQAIHFLKADDVQSARVSINQIISNDPNAIVTEEYQRPLIQQLTRLTNTKPPTAASIDASKLVLGLASQYPKSLIQREIVADMQADIYHQAVALVQQEKLVDAFVLIDGFRRQFKEQRGSEKLAAMSKHLADEIISRAHRIKRSKGDEAYLTHLEELGRKTKGTVLQKSIAPMLASLAVSMARGGSTGVNNEAKEARLKIAKELALQLGDPGLVKNAQLKATQNNVRASSMLRSALRVQQSGDLDSAVKRYAVLIQTYPDTSAAESARSQLTVLKNHRRRSGGDEFNLESMIRKNNSARASR